MFWFLVIATIPAGILSLVLDKLSEMIVGENLNIEIIKRTKRIEGKLWT